MAATRTDTAPTGAAQLALYRDMVLIRRFEEKAGQLYGLGLIGGFCPLSIGQEAVAVGLEAALGPGDRRITGHRSHAQLLAAGVDPGATMAELLGRATGLCGGRAGSLGMLSGAQGVFGGHAAPGAQVPLALGLALAQRHTDRVTLCCFGDGAAARGQVNEAYAAALALALPVVFVIENNADSRADPTGASPLLDQARGFGLSGVAVDGADVLAVRAAAVAAVAFCRGGGGPALIEACTPRFRGHALDMSEMARADERRRRKTRDPLAILADRLIADAHADAGALRRIDRDARATVDAAAQFARDSPDPPDAGPDPDDPTPDPATGSEPAEALTFRDAISHAIATEMRADDSVVLMTPELDHAPGQDSLVDRFGPDRVIVTAPGAQSAAGLAVGGAMGGLRPILRIPNLNLALAALDAMTNTAATLRWLTGGSLTCPVVFWVGTGHVARAGARHGVDHAALLAAFPGLKVVAPASPDDALGLMRAAIRDPGPVVVLDYEALHAQPGQAIATDPVPIGAARLRRAGADATLLAFGPGVVLALDAAARLGTQGIGAEVLDLRCLRPLDHAAILASVRKTGLCVTVEEGPRRGGIGEAIAALLGQQAFGALRAPPILCHGADGPMPYAENLERRALPDVETIVARVRVHVGG